VGLYPVSQTAGRLFGIGLTEYGLNHSQQVGTGLQHLSGIRCIDATDGDDGNTKPVTGQRQGFKPGG
jgi:hypothetical protein